MNQHTESHQFCNFCLLFDDLHGGIVQLYGTHNDDGTADINTQQQNMISPLMP